MAVTSNEPIPLRDLMSVALRILPVALVVGGLSGLVGASQLSSESTDPQATVTVGLTEEVRWPFFEPVRGRIATAFDDELAAQVGREFPSIVEVRAEVPDALAVVDFIAVADQPEVASAAAERAAELTLDQTVAESRVALNDQITQINAEIAELEQQVAADDDALSTLFDQQAAATSGSSRAQALADQISVQRRERDARLQRILDLQSNRGDAEADLAGARPQATIVGRSVDEPAGGDSTGLLAVALAGATAVLTLAGGTYLLANFGSIRSCGHLRSVLPHDVRCWGDGTAPVGVLRWFVKRFDPRAKVGVYRTSGAEWARVLQTWSARVTPGTQVTEFVDIHEGTAAHHLLDCEHAVVFASRQDTVRSIRRSIRWIEGLGLPVAGVIYAEAAGNPLAGASPGELEDLAASMQTAAPTARSTSGQRTGPPVRTRRPVTRARP